MTQYIDSTHPDASAQVSQILRQCILASEKHRSEFVFLCIGSDRMTGDCLGPLVGNQLNANSPGRFFAYGTLLAPIHALNLESSTARIHSLHPNALTIAVDAALGEKEQLGFIRIRQGALYPGAGLRKNLPPVGDISITGIVNLAGVLEQLTLQTTRLSTVLSMSETISAGILELFSNTHAL